MVRDLAGGRWEASRVRVGDDGNALHVDLRCGADVRLGLSQVAEIDFSVGTMKALVDLPPLSRGSRGGFEFLVDLPGADRLFGPRVVAPSSSGTASAGGLEFVGGGEIAYRLPPGFSRLVGTVELRPEGEKFTPVVFRVFVDSDVVWEAALDQPYRSVAFDVPVRDDARLKLVVQPKSEVPLGAVVFVHQPRLLR